ncbi:MAG: polysaccharide deacetylase family protein [Oscillospiraceae bacterium]|nr:polysaccharide deacetylase family protein [Oscillospiraceae bacterium]
MKRTFVSICSAMMMAACIPISANAAGYGQGKAVNGQNQPTGALEFQAQYAQNDAYALTEAADSILLTFDQGYENGYTAKILDTLKEHHVKALFFITGDYAKSEPQLINRMIAEGHALGNHGMRHLKASELSAEALREEIGSLHSYVLQNYGYEMQYYRPPCGDYDAEALQTVQEMGYKTVFWSFAYVDWNTDAQPDPETAKQTLIQAAHPNGIYLLHSVSSANAAVLGDVITELKAMGYRV